LETFYVYQTGFINSDIFRLYLKPIIGEIKIKDLKKELIINATDLIQGETFVFSGDDYLLDAIIASCSVPDWQVRSKKMNYFLAMAEFSIIFLLI
jgi:NTE family protein